jgi:hypothetical protein
MFTIFHLLTAVQVVRPGRELDFNRSVNPIGVFGVPCCTALRRAGKHSYDKPVTRQLGVIDRSELRNVQIPKGTQSL